MKRIIFIALPCALLSLLFGGCSVFNGKFDGREYLVSALGVDEYNGKITLCAEIIVSGGENSEAAAETEITEKSGETVEETVYFLRQSSSEPLIFSHCGLIIVGEAVSAETLSELCDFCHDCNDITVSVAFASAKNPLTLISNRKNGSISSGYDIVNMLKQQSDYSGTKYRNRFYEFYTVKGKPSSTFTLPHLNSDEKGAEIDGLSVFVDYALVSQLNHMQSFAYSLITDSQGKGKTVIKGEEIGISSAHGVWQVFGKSERPELCINLKLTEKNGEIERIISDEISSLFEKAEKTGTDFFGLDNTAYTAFGNSFRELKNSIITVKVK